MSKARNLKDYHWKTFRLTVGGHDSCGESCFRSVGEIASIEKYSLLSIPDFDSRQRPQTRAHLRPACDSVATKNWE